MKISSLFNSKKPTNEQIIKMLCEYHEQRVECITDVENAENATDKIQTIDIKQQVIVVNDLEFYIGDDEIKLILKPLTKLNEKHEMELCDILQTHDVSFFLKSLMNKHTYSVSTKSMIDAIQFLTECGYDIPRREFEMKTLFDVGLATYE